MIRDIWVEREAEQIAREIWPRLARYRPMPAIESKHGGHTGAYYPREHTIRVRSNVWKKMSLGNKRLLMIHELWHARGIDHQPLFLSSFDVISLSVYERIYGFDAAWSEMRQQVNEAVNAIVQ